MRRAILGVTEGVAEPERRAGEAGASAGQFGGPGGGRVEGVLLTYAAWIMVILSLLAGVICVVTTVLSLRPEGMSRPGSDPSHEC